MFSFEEMKKVVKQQLRTERLKTCEAFSPALQHKKKVTGFMTIRCRLQTQQQTQLLNLIHLTPGALLT